MKNKYLYNTRKELYEKLNNSGRCCECECPDHDHTGKHNIVIEGKVYLHWKPMVIHLIPTTFNVMLVCRFCHEKIVASTK